MTSADAAPARPAAVDNDILIKAACYRLQNELLGDDQFVVLGAAPYVVAGRIPRMRLTGDRDAAMSAAMAVFERSTILEPVSDELSFAAEIEALAQRRGLELDAGESQLAALVITRGLAVLKTGDKRAVRAFEDLLDVVPRLDGLTARVRCLEQLVQDAASSAAGDPDAIARAICAEPDVDKALTICSRCSTPPPSGPAVDHVGLQSYIARLRNEAPRVLQP